MPTLETDCGKLKSVSEFEEWYFDTLTALESFRRTAWIEDRPGLFEGSLCGMGSTCARRFGVKSG